MPNTQSAKKALRQTVKRRAANRSQRSALRTLIKKFRTAAAGTDREAAQTAFRAVVKRIDQIAAKGLLHRNSAARTKSRLSRVLAGPAEASK